MKNRNKTTHVDLFSARDALKALGFAHDRSVNEGDFKAPGFVEFGSHWTHPDGREFYLNFKTIGSLPA
jgi:hypothetical protein